MIQIHSEQIQDTQLTAVRILKSSFVNCWKLFAFSFPILLLLKDYSRLTKNSPNIKPCAPRVICRASIKSLATHLKTDYNPSIRPIASLMTYRHSHKQTGYLFFSGDGVAFYFVVGLSLFRFVCVYILEYNYINIDILIFVWGL